MNSFLLSLGVAIVLALVAALVGPYFIDWSGYRAQVEARISEMTGSDATIGGDLEIRFLPTGSVNISGLEIQRGDAPFPILIVPDLSAEFSLAAFLRGRIEILEVAFTQPIVSLTLRDDGSPAFAAGLQTEIGRESIAVGEFTVTDGTLVFVAENGTPLHTLSGIALSGNAETLVGPIRLEGEFDSGPVRYAFRLGTGRVQADGGVRAKLNLTSSHAPGSVSLDAILALANGRPVVDGLVTIDRLSGVGPANPRGPIAAGSGAEEFDDGTRWTDVADGPGLDFPWKLTASISGGVDNLLLQDVDIQVGAADKAISLTGTARAGLYPDPNFSAILSARQLDLDRVMGGGLAAGETVSPIGLPGVLNELAGRFVSLGIPIDLSISADGVLLGGNLVENLAADLQLRDDRIVVDRISGRLPGGTDLFLAGTFKPGQLPGIESVVRLSSDNGAALATWIGIDRAAFGPLFAAGARTKIEFEGGVSTAPDRITIRDAVASIDGNRISGGISYPLGNNPGDIEFTLDFGALDLDKYVPPERVARELGETWLEGIAGALLSGRDMAIRLTAESLSSGTINAEGLDVNVGISGDVLTVHRLNVANLSGASFAGRGQIDDIFDKANGSISSQMEIKNLGDFLPFLNSVFGISSISSDMAQALSPVVVDLNLAADSSADGTNLTLDLNGDLAGTIFTLDGTFAGQLASFADGTFTANLMTEETVGQIIIAQFGLGELSDSGAGQGPASLYLALEGRASEALAATGGATFLGSEFVFSGSFFPGEESSLSGNLELTTGNIAPLVDLLGLPAAGSENMPVSLRTFVVASGTGVDITSLTGQMAGSAISGDLELGRDGDATRVDGRITTDALSLPWLLTLFLGEDSGALTDAGERWPATPFDLSGIDRFTGQVTVVSGKALLGRGIALDALAFDLVANGRKIGIENLTARHGDVGIEADLNLIGDDGGQVATTLRLKLDGGALQDYLIRSGRAPYASGSFTLSGQVSGAGRSWRGVVASLDGDGAIRVGPGEIEQLDPAAFERLLIAADGKAEPLALTEATIAETLGSSLDEGSLEHDGMDTVFSISDGVLEARNAIIVSDVMPVRGEITIDIPQLGLESSWEFAPLSVQLEGGEEVANIPAVERRITGPLGGESDEIYIAALTGWLGVRRMEKSLAELEQARAAVREQQAQEQETLENLAVADQEPEDASVTPEPETGDAVQSAGLDPTPEPPSSPAPDTPSDISQGETNPDTPPADDQAATAPENIPEEIPEEIEVSELPDTTAPPVSAPPVSDRSLNEIVQDALREAGREKPSADPVFPPSEESGRQTGIVPDLPPPTNLGPVGQPNRQTSVVPPRGLNSEPAAPVRNQRPQQPPTAQSPEGAGMMN